VVGPERRGKKGSGALPLHKWGDLNPKKGGKCLRGGDRGKRGRKENVSSPGEDPMEIVVLKKSSLRLSSLTGFSVFLKSPRPS